MLSRKYPETSQSLGRTCIELLCIAGHNQALRHKNPWLQGLRLLFSSYFDLMYTAEMPVAQSYHLGQPTRVKTCAVHGGDVKHLPIKPANKDRGHRPCLPEPVVLFSGTGLFPQRP